MNNWKVIPTIVIATVLIFGAGVFTGGFLVNSVKPAHAKKNKEAVAANNSVMVTNVAPTNSFSQSVGKFQRLPEILSKEFLQRLDTELKLTHEQHEAVQKIISEGQGQMKKAMNAARLEIREVLMPEQQKQFDTQLKRPPRKPGLGANPTIVPPPNTSSAVPTNAP